MHTCHTKMDIMSKEKVTYRKRSKEAIKPLSILWSKNLSVLSNIKFLALEMLFAKNITQVMLDTASMPFNEPDADTPSKSRANADSWRGDSGYITPIANFLPATLFAHLLEKHLIDLLYHKYSNTYNFLIPGRTTASYFTSISHIGDKTIEHDISAVNYRVNKDFLPEISAYCSKIEALWLTTETFVALTSYAYSNSIELALFLTGILELIKRLRI